MISARRLSRAAREWALLAAAFLLVGSVVAFASFQEHGRISVYERQRLETQLQMVEDRLGSEISAVGAALAAISKTPEIFDRADTGSLTSLRLRGLLRLLPGVGSIQLIDAAGIVRASSDDRRIGRSVADESAFIAVRSGAAAQASLLVSRPSRAPGADVQPPREGLALVRGLQDRQQAFTGIVCAVLDEQRLSRLLAPLIYAPDMRLALADRSGNVLASGGAPAAGNPSSEAADFTLRHELLPEGAQVDSALVLIAQRSPAAIYAGWRSRATVAFSLYVVMLAACVAGLLIAQRRRRLRDSTREAEQEEQRSHAERLDFILSGANIGLWDWNLPSNAIVFSDRWYAMLGLSAADLGDAPDAWQALVHPADAPRLHAALTRYRADGIEKHELEYRLRHSSGSWVWVMDRGKLMERDIAGAPLRIVGAHMDITPHKRAEEALRQSEARFRALTELSSDWYWELDDQHRFAHFEGYSDTEIGMPKEDNIGLTRWDLGALNMSDEDWQRHRNALDAHEVFHDLELQRLDTVGNVYWVSISGAPIFTPEGRFRGYRGIGRSITERKRVEDEIERLAFYDALTGLPNRRLLLDRLVVALGHCRARAERGALLFIDLDNFKDLNDTMGHDVGDSLLERVANRIVTCVKPGDTVARLGGDEFVVMLEGLPDDEALAAGSVRSVAEHVLEVLNHPYLLEGYQHHSTPSLGIALFDGDVQSVDDLLKRADLAMYQAKAAGRNTLCFFHPDMQQAVIARSVLESNLRNAIANDELLLYYQPVVNHMAQLMGAEALLRWRHPVRGLVSPGDFIPLAEQTGLILGIGQWVMEAACEQLVEWALHAETSGLTIAVNVSARQFRQLDFVPGVLSTLQRTGARPDRLKIELTESLLLNDVEDIIAKMQALKAHGVGFSLDDFGTGYSSLSYLKRLPLDQLKIDQSFVRDVLTDPNDAAIVRTILALAESLDLAVVAEGVETEGQNEFLRRSGCKAFQGYFFGRPAPVQDLLGSLQPAPLVAPAAS